jgi:hypothetical protein
MKADDDEEEDEYMRGLWIIYTKLYSPLRQKFIQKIYTR